jgi:preprotein translocase subunit SecE
VSKVEDVSKMSEKEKDKKTQKKVTFFHKVLGWFQRVFVTSFKNMFAEIKKVTWPSRQDLINYSIVVVTFMVFMAVVIGVLDLASSSLISVLIKQPGV